MRSDFPHEATWSLVWVSAFVGGRMLPSAQLGLPACPLLRLAGLPCPTCGGTRAWWLASHGDFYSAFLMNPATALVFVLGALWTVYSLARLAGLPRSRMFLPDPLVRWGLVAALLANWAWVLSAGRVS